jgi:ribonuclease HI
LDVIKATIYVDTSYNNGTCCSGYVIHVGEGKPLMERSPLFEAVDNNEAEIHGVYIAVKVALSLIKKKYGDSIDKKFFVFKVYNDNHTAVASCCTGYVPRKKATKRMNVLLELKEYCGDNRITLNCIHKKRSDVTIKKCDRLSKEYRKEYRKEKKRIWN